KRVHCVTHNLKQLRSFFFPSPKLRKNHFCTVRDIPLKVLYCLYMTLGFDRGCEKGDKKTTFSMNIVASACYAVDVDSTSNSGSAKTPDPA
ncbi:TPA: hypothetical protein ACU1XZ_004699, partial [Salmonella enterica]